MAFMKEYMDDRNKVKRENNEDDEDLDQLLEKEKASKGRLMNINEQKLIELVENNPHLYNPHDANYHNHSERDKSWVEIAEILDHARNKSNYYFRLLIILYFSSRLS